jgi:PAS domain-containing protein
MSTERRARRSFNAHSILTIPSSDLAFAAHVNAVNAKEQHATPAAFERRLRTVFPRVVVRERSLSGETAAWYVYRDGAWRPTAAGPWWLDEGLPRVVVDEQGWVVDATRTAADLLGIDESEVGQHHFTDFVAPGALEDSTGLFDVVKQGNELEATVVLRPTSGDLIAVELHAARDGGALAAVFRLADDVDIPAQPGRVRDRPALTFFPATDVAFRAYTQRALERMAEPTSSGLELRLRRLYPHAVVVVGTDDWTVQRDHAEQADSHPGWWLDAATARVRYDAQGLILHANDAAAAMFGRQMAGHHWQEFVTPGSTEQVAVMLDILAEVGAAESRFRMPRSDGSLLEFDSYTEVADDEFTTAFRPVAA